MTPKNRPEKYRQWVNKPSGDPNFFDNLEIHLQLPDGLGCTGATFAWNFIGRQNGVQGFLLLE